MSAGRSRFLPRPFELLTLGMVAAIVLYLRWQGLRLDFQTVRYVGAAVLHRLPTVVALGFALQLVARLLERRSPLPWLRALLAPRSLWLWVRTWVVLTAVTYAYSWLKVSVPLLRRGLLDESLWSLDRALHFGISPSVFAVELFRGTALTQWIDFWYILWLTTVVAIQSYVLLSAGLAERRNFAFACAALWLTGAWIYLALPAVGPCFFAPEVFADLRAQLPNAAHLQGRLWDNYLGLVAGRETGVRQFKPFLAVAAMPSLHVGAHWLFALWARRHERRLFVPFVIATFLTFLGSIVTGWHYAVDGYVGMLLAWGAVVAADRFEPVAGSEAAPETAADVARSRLAGPGEREGAPSGGAGRAPAGD